MIPISRLGKQARAMMEQEQRHRREQRRLQFMLRICGNSARAEAAAQRRSRSFVGRNIG